MIKQMVIPVAAFAVTATGVSAFSGDLLQKLDLDLTDGQVAAFEEAHELRQEGADREVIKVVLEAADIDRERVREVRQAAHEYRHEVREAIRDAVAAGDYDAFRTIVEDMPRLSSIDTVEEFEQLMEAHELREAGDYEGAREIMSELGFEKPEKRGRHAGHFNG